MATGTYKRMFHRWEILRGWIPAMIFTIIAVGIELLFFAYMMGRGLVDESFTMSFGILKIPLSIAFFLSMGNAILLLVLWISVFENTAYVMTGPDKSVRRLLYPIRMVRAASLILAPFTFVLFIPYIIQSSWFIGLMSSLATSVPSLKQSIINFYQWSFGVGRMDASTRFVASQLLAALSSATVAGVQIWRVKGARNLMLLLRRRK